jgi:hypothetical protein
MSNLRKFIEAVRTGGHVPRELAADAADYIETRLDAAAKGGQIGGKISKRPPRLTDPKSVMTRNRVRRHRLRKASAIE